MSKEEKLALRESKLPENRTWDVPLIGQDTDSWCWNASSQMIAQSFGFDEFTQAEAANELGKREDEGGSRNDAKRAMRFYSDNDLRIKVKNKEISSLELRETLQNSPVYISRGWYDEEGNRYGGHATVITGYNFDEFAFVKLSV